MYDLDSIKLEFGNCLQIFKFTRLSEGSLWPQKVEVKMKSWMMVTETPSDDAQRPQSANKKRAVGNTRQRRARGPKKLHFSCTHRDFSTSQQHSHHILPPLRVRARAVQPIVKSFKLLHHQPNLAEWETSSTRPPRRSCLAPTSRMSRLLAASRTRLSRLSTIVRARPGRGPKLNSIRRRSS